MAVDGALLSGGEGGIRTRGRLSPTPDFESGTFDHSATSPADGNIAQDVPVDFTLSAFSRAIPRPGKPGRAVERAGDGSEGGGFPTRQADGRGESVCYYCRLGIRLLGVLLLALFHFAH